MEEEIEISIEQMFELVNDKLIGIITLLTFIDSKLEIIVKNMPKSTPYGYVGLSNHYKSITCSKED